MSRLQSIKVLKSVVNEHNNLQDALSSYLKRDDFPFISELCFGVSRYFHQLEIILNHLIDKPLKSKDVDIKLLLMIGLYELTYLSTPDFAAVDETVKVTRQIKKKWAAGFVNATLRGYIREKTQINEALQKDKHYALSTPAWLLKLIEQDYPSMAESIMRACNIRPKTVIRVNKKKIKREDYLNALNQKHIKARPVIALPDAITIEDKMRITDLPCFEEGYFSVQDTAAQCAITLLSVEKNLRILDACSAPGGKLTHILEQGKTSEVVALDNKPHRLEIIKENLRRLGLDAELICADASQPDKWWDGRLFDRILLDAPCSATGIVRKHPEIKLLRTPKAIDDVCLIQQALLTALWPLLKKDGVMLYATCSILKQENDHQISTFLSKHTDALISPIKLPFGHQTEHGWQLLPPETDGFYYSKITKLT